MSLGHVGRNQNLKDLKETKPETLNPTSSTRNPEPETTMQADEAAQKMVPMTPSLDNRKVAFECFRASNLGGDVTKFAPRNALKLIA